MAQCRFLRSALTGVALYVLFLSFAQAQTPNGRTLAPANVRPRITQAINPKELVARTGNIHPLARPKFDRGAAPDSMPAERMLLVLQRSPEQQGALQQFLDEQHTKDSPNYRRWLTPDEFGQMFGPADADINTITNWLTSNGFQVNQVASGRNLIEFSGTVGQVRQAFHTDIHKFVVNGREHWANVSNPQIPAALAPVVGGIASLHSFRKKPLSHKVALGASKSGESDPQSTLSCSNGTCYGLAPYDFATIYNLQPVWSTTVSGKPLDGTGQSIAVVGRSNIDLQDIRDFRSQYALPAKDPEVIVNGIDPGIWDTDEQVEATLDVEWSGAVAKGADIKFVVTSSTDFTDGVDLSAVYAVQRNLAPVISVSFGQCEDTLGATNNALFQSLWQQAAAQGIAVFVSTGDNGSAGCDNQNTTEPGNANNYVAASNGVFVNGLASTPFNVAVGGTDFDQVANPSLYWNGTNDGTTQASAKSYIPEMTWNESCAQQGSTCNAALIAKNGIWAGSGGRSVVYDKPSWQSGPGVPADLKRDLPDVALFSSTGFNKSFYLVLMNGTIFGVGGTSAAAPAMAGIMAIVNQKQNGPQGNPNYVLYQLAAQTNASCNSSTVGTGANSCTFYDIGKGNNAVPCTGSLNCVSGATVDPNNVASTAWVAGPGYDLATGLGSVNVKNLVDNWASVNFTPTTTTITKLLPATLTHGQQTSVSVDVAPNSGTGTPTGDVALIADFGTSQRKVDVFTLPIVSQTTRYLPGGSYNVIARYAGDGTYAASESAPIPVNVGKENSATWPFLYTYDSSGFITDTFATAAEYGSQYILHVDVTNGTSSPLNNEDCWLVDIWTCPSGTVTITDNGAPLGAGTFALNSYGMAEDITVQFTGGSHTLVANYSGDNSFNSNTATTTLTIAKAATAISAPSNPGTAPLNSPVNLVATVTTNSNGAAPTAPVVFKDGGTTLTGSTSYVALPGSGTTPASLKATLNTTFTTSGTHSVTASYGGDINYLSSTSGSTNVVVVGSTVTKFKVTAPASTTSGAALIFTVTAQDSSNGTVAGYNGTVHFTSTDGAATLPANATLTSGVGTFSATLRTAGNQTITATDTVNAAITGTSASIAVSTPQPATHFSVTAPPSAAVGTAVNFTVTALDANNNAATTYAGTVQFTSTDAAAALPGNSTLTNGTRSFSATLNTAGNQTITATDTATASIAGTSGAIAVSTAAADFSIVSTPNSATVAKGTEGSAEVTVSWTGGMTSAVDLTCGVAPIVAQGPTCRFIQTSLTPGTNSTATTRLAVSTTAPHKAAMLHKGSGWILGGGTGLFACVLLGIPGLRRRAATSVLVLLIGLALLGGTLACGGSKSSSGGNTIDGPFDPGTPAGSYEVTVTATSGSTVRTTSFTMTVQ